MHTNILDLYRSGCEPLGTIASRIRENCNKRKRKKDNDNAQVDVSQENSTGIAGMKQSTITIKKTYSHVTESHVLYGKNIIPKIYLQKMHKKRQNNFMYEKKSRLSFNFF